IAVSIATGKTTQLAGHLGRALANGVQPYRGLGRLGASGDLLRMAERGLGTGGLRAGVQRAEGRHRRAACRCAAPSSSLPRRGTGQSTDDELPAVAPKFVQLTNDVVFGDLWRRCDLSLRDRSLVALAALPAMHQDDQTKSYFRRGVP